MKSVYTSLGLCASVAYAASRTTAPAGCVTVSKSGTGNYTTIQSAVDADPPCIFIEPGTYHEQVLITQRTAVPFSIYGYTEDDTSFEGNQVTIVNGLSQADGLNNDQTGTLRVKTNGFRLYNVVVENSYGEGSQAIAVSAYADSGYYGSTLIGYQDTLLANQGRQVYVDTQIVGATDFIFGHAAQAWFERADLRVIARDIGYITAHGRQGEDSSFYAFDHSTISAAEGEDVVPGTYYLGRPWRAYARVVFQNTDMTDVINPAGWRIWNTGDPRTDFVLYGEYENTGAGAEGDRADFATQLSAPVEMDEVLGSGYENEAWFDAQYFEGRGADVSPPTCRRK
ncbi:hypothetical protein S40285_04479 [Stachybotrys chlorohalonatus IBT 40285]|uniref:Pectinesterase n=1 Tax=Stachybotrys chlorohalonatus (strain IBT 40285) TaxID=1283841 RepID=A0A084QIS4_STAC4|nr:hypothetical protein S40285_04479 [Stachybotrys chlorohalonata IBT 40285]